MRKEVSLKDLLDFRKVNYCVRSRHKKYLAGERDFFPWSVEIHPTSRCNYDCSYCAYSIRNKGNRSIADDALKSLFDVLVINGVKGIFFSGGGEPLLYPRIYDLIVYLDRAGVKVSLLTNGSVIADERYSEMISSLDYIAVSIPSMIPEEFKKMTGRGMPKNLPDLPTLLRANRRKVPIIGSRLVVYKENCSQVIDNILKIKSAGFDYCIVKIPKDPEERGLEVDQEDISSMRQQLSEKGSELNEDFTNLGDVLDLKGPAKPMGDVCWSIEYGVNCFIHTDGGVYLCLPLMGKKEFCIGNIHDENFDDIWKGDRRKQVIELLQKRYKAMECRNCRNIAYNNVIENYPDSGFSKSMDPFL